MFVLSNYITVFSHGNFATACIPSKFEADISTKFFTTPLYDFGEYPSSRIVCWQISVDSGKRIALSVPKSDLEDSSNCENDYGIIYDGPSTNSKVLKKWCGDLENFKVETSSNRAFIIFNSDQNSITGRGFKVEYKEKASSSTSVGDELLNKTKTIVIAAVTSTAAIAILVVVLLCCCLKCFLCKCCC